MKKTKKTGKPVRKSAKKHNKTGLSQALRAFMLVSAIIVVTVIISCAVIIVHSSMKNNDKIDEIIAAPVQENAPQNNSLVESVQPSSGHGVQTNTSSQSHGNQNAAENTQNTTSPAQPSNSTQSVNPSSNTRPAANHTSNPGTAEKAPSIPAYRGALVFVIDDAGNNLRELDPFLNIQSPLTIAVLPGLPYSAEAARRIRAAGKEVILHQPMEAIGAQNPGPGAIYSGMSAGEIRTVLSRNIAEVGPVAGINNHQGSKITMDIEAMQTILAFCAENNLYFLDSRTTAETAAPLAAQRMGMKIVERNIFIDNEQNRESMLSYISSGLTRAHNSGAAVMIGHAWSPELAPLLAQQFPLYIEQGYTIKTVSDILK